MESFNIGVHQIFCIIIYGSGNKYIIWLWLIYKWFCDASISENVEGTKLYKFTKFHALMKT